MGLGVVFFEVLLWIFLIEFEGKGKIDCLFGYLVFFFDKLLIYCFYEEFVVLRYLCILCSFLESNKFNYR